MMMSPATAQMTRVFSAMLSQNGGKEFPCKGHFEWTISARKDLILRRICAASGIVFGNVIVEGLMWANW